MDTVHTGGTFAHLILVVYNVNNGNPVSWGSV